MTDLAWATYDGADVRFYLNDPTTPVYTAAVSGLTLYGACAFYDAGAGLNSLRFGPTTNLAVSDTPQLNANAATALYTLAVASAASLATGAISTIGSITVGPFPYATSVICTFTGIFDNASTTKTNQLSYGWYTTAASYTSPLATVPPFASAGTGDAQGVIGQELTYALAANTTQTYYLNCQSPAAPAFGIGMLNVNLKCEAIKR